MRANYWLHSITSFYEHCQLLDYLEDEKVIAMDDIPKYNKESFKDYVMECKSFEGLYLQGNKVKKTPEDLKQEILDRRDNPEKYSKKPVQKITGKNADVEFLIFCLKKSYLSFRLSHICLFPKRYNFAPWLDAQENAIYHFTLQALQVMII